MSTHLRRAGLVAVAALVLAACSSAEPTSGDSSNVPTDSSSAADESSPSGGSFVYISDLEPTSFDTGSFRNLTNYNVAAQILDPLVAQGPGGEYFPSLAESWTSSDDGLVWTFTLRDDVTFHDGEKLTAQAVQASVERALALRPQGWFGSSRAVDELTWELTLPDADAPVLQAFSNPNYPILSLTSLEAYTDADRATDPTTIVGTGPFIVESYTPGSGLVLTRNEDYNWAPEYREHQGSAYLDTVEIRFISESQSRLGTLTSGQADAAASIPPGDLEALLDGDGFTYAAAASQGVPYSALLNTESGPTADPLVREALRAALDIDTAVGTIYSGFYSRAWTALAPETAPSGAYNEALEGSYTYDPARAEQLLDEAGWSETDAAGYRTKDGERLTLDWIVDTSDIRDQRDVIIQALQADAREAGIEINIEQGDSNTYGDRGASGDYSIIAESWGQSDAFLLGLSVDPAAIPPNGLNYSRITDPETGELATRAASSTDDAERAELYRQIQQIQVDEVHNIPIYIQDFIVATTNAVSGVSFNQTGWPDAFYDVTVN